MPKAIGSARKPAGDRRKSHAPFGSGRLAGVPRAELQPTDAKGYAGCSSAQGPLARRSRRGHKTFLDGVEFSAAFRLRSDLDYSRDASGD